MSRQADVAEKLAPWQENKIVADIENVMQQIKRSEFDMRVHFPTKFASMAPENLLASIIAAKNNVDLEALLSGREISPEQMKNMDAMYEMTQTVLSKSRREALGIMDLLKEVGAYAFNEIPSPNQLGQNMNLNKKIPSKYAPKANKAGNLLPLGARLAFKGFNKAVKSQQK